MSAVFDRFQTYAATADVLASSFSEPRVLSAKQQVRLTQLLKHAQHGSRYYQRHLSGVKAGDTPLVDLPVSKRGELMAQFDDWVTDPSLKLDQLLEFATDPDRIGESYLGKYIVWESSGTSNQPGIYVQDARAMAVYDALEATRHSIPRLLHRFFDPMLLTERIAYIGATTGHFATIASLIRMRRINPLLSRSLRCFSILQPPEALANELNQFAPTVVVTYPTMALVLTSFVKRGLLRTTPNEIWTGGEKLNAATRQQIETELRCVVRDSYGASEFYSIGWECRHGRMHINTDWMILEPIDERGRPMPSDQRSHSALLTNLANHVQPLIRFELGDQFTLLGERCECGSPFPAITIDGRCDDTLVMHGSDGQPVTLSPMALTTVLEEVAGVMHFQVRQRDEHTLMLNLDSRESPGSATEQRCCSALKSFAATNGITPFRVVVERDTPFVLGKSGKAKRVIGRTGKKQQ